MAFEKTAQGNFAQMTFEEFWALYPRKISRKDALKAWAELNDGQRFEAVHSLPTHVRYWKTTSTGSEFLPYPATWLRGERWTDELEMPEAKQPDWWKTTAGITAKAQEVGVEARAGEDWHSLKARVMAKVAA